MSQRRTFFERLFDFSFDSAIAPQVVGVLYGIALAGIGLAVLAAIFGGLARGAGSFFAALIIAPIVAFIYLLFIRVALEGLVAGIKTAQNTTEMVKLLRQIRNERRI